MYDQICHFLSNKHLDKFYILLQILFVIIALLYFFRHIGLVLVLACIFIFYLYNQDDSDCDIEEFTPFANRDNTSQNTSQNSSQNIGNAAGSNSSSGFELPLQNWTQLPSPDKLKIYKPESLRFCLDQHEIRYDPSFVSSNALLSGPPNPKTEQKTYVIPPAPAWDFWADNHYVPSNINSELSFDTYRSGYDAINPMNYNNYVLKDTRNNPSPTGNPIGTNFAMTTGVANDASFNAPNTYRVPLSQTMYQNNLVEGYTQANFKNGSQDFVDFYYNQNQLKNGLPSNLPAGECTRSNLFNQYNNNLFTTPIQPNTFVKNEIIQPVQSNMGISFTPQFQPYNCSNNKQQNGNTLITYLDPNTYKPEPIQYNIVPNVSNVYDPRYTGYGTSYRSYYDPLSGQTRYYYDDIDAIKRPNYIVRSKIDDAEWADQYGAMKPNEYHLFAKQMADDKFMNDSLRQRTELQQRYMDKYNTQIGWQRRMAPIRTNNTIINTAKA